MAVAGGAPAECQHVPACWQTITHCHSLHDVRSCSASERRKPACAKERFAGRAPALIRGRHERAAGRRPFDAALQLERRPLLAGQVEHAHALLQPPPRPLAAEDVQALADDARRVAAARARHVAVAREHGPRARGGVEQAHGESRAGVLLAFLHVPAHEQNAAAVLHRDGGGGGGEAQRGGVVAAAIDGREGRGHVCPAERIKVELPHVRQVPAARCARGAGVIRRSGWRMPLFLTACSCGRTPASASCWVLRTAIAAKEVHGAADKAAAVLEARVGVLVRCHPRRAPRVVAWQAVDPVRHGVAIRRGLTNVDQGVPARLQSRTGSSALHPFPYRHGATQTVL